MASFARYVPPWEILGRAAQLERLLDADGEDDLETILPDDRQRYRLLERLRWPEGFQCARCEVKATPERPRPGILVCARCRSFVGVTARTPLAGEIAIERWFSLLWQVAGGHVGLDGQAIARALDVGSVAADEVVTDLRQTMVRAGFVRVRNLVELDARPFDLGGVHILLLIAAERHPLHRPPYLHPPGAVAIRRVPNLSAEVVRGFVRAAVQPGASIFTDCWSDYVKLDTLPYLHEPSSPLPGSLEAVDAVASELRAFIGPRPPTRLELDHRLAEHALRRNRIARHPRGQVFAWLLVSALSIEREPKLRSGVRSK